MFGLSKEVVKKDLSEWQSDLAARAREPIKEQKVQRVTRYLACIMF